MKRLPRTPELENRLRAAFGADADISTLVAFECVAANLLPLRRKGGLYEKARFSLATLQEMAAAVNKESISFHAMHDNYTLPLGRTFYGQVVGDELVCQFAINEKTQPGLVADIDSGILDQVSVGMLPRQLMCSECDFDYLGEGATFDNYYDRTCSNNHTIGENGVHARVLGCANWYELSGVNKGAVDGAKIRGPSQAVLSDSGPGWQRLAASGASNALTCNAVTAKEDTHMSKELVDALAAAAAGRATAEASVGTLTAANAALTTAATAHAAELKAANDAKDAAVAALAAAPAQADIDAAVAVLTEVATKMTVALGEKDASIPKTVAELKAFIEDRNTKLTAALAAGPRSEAAPVIQASVDEPRKTSAFGVRR